jgi:hypothetical protein
MPSIYNEYEALNALGQDLEDQLLPHVRRAVDLHNDSRFQDVPYRELHQLIDSIVSGLIAERVLRGAMALRHKRQVRWEETK